MKKSEMMSATVMEMSTSRILKMCTILPLNSWACRIQKIISALCTVCRVGNLYFRSISLKLKSDPDQFVQVAHDKRATMSEALGSFSKTSIHSKKLLKKMVCIFRMFPPFQRANRCSRSSLCCSFLKRDHERITQVALNKRAAVRDSLRSLKTKEQL